MTTKTQACADCGSEYHPGPHIDCPECGDYADGLSGCSCGRTSPMSNSPVVATVKAAAGGYKIVPNHQLAVRWSSTGRSRLGYQCILCNKRSRRLGQFEHYHCRHELYAEPFGMQKAFLEMRAGRRHPKSK